MITPLDLKKHEFGAKLFGFDKDEVRALLDSVAKEMESLIHQNTQLSERLKVVEERLNHYRLIEKTLQDAVLTMQTTLEEKRRVAEQEAELILQQARHKADDELLDARGHLSQLRTEIYQLENQRTTFFLRIRNMLQHQMDVLDAMSEASDEQREPLPLEEEFHMAEPSKTKMSSVPHGERFVRDVKRA